MEEEDSGCCKGDENFIAPGWLDKVVILASYALQPALSCAKLSEWGGDGA